MDQSLSLESLEKILESVYLGPILVKKIPLKNDP